MKADPDHADYIARWSAVYEQKNYGRGLAGYFLSKSHIWCESPFGVDTYFDRVLEVGAGTGVHLGSVKHRYREYWMTDLHPAMTDRIADRPSLGQVFVKSENAASLSFGDCSFDRVIATHVLEHLERPHLVLREWVRVLKPGGCLSLVLPCDPGLAWRFGRNLGPRHTFRRAGIDYDYWMAREHINSITNLVSLVRFYFDRRDESWWPLRLPLSDINLFYICHLWK